MGSLASLTDADRPVVMFDGVCNLCNSSVQFIIRHDPSGKFAFASLQSPVAEKLLMGYNLQHRDLYSILLLKNGILYDRSDAIVEIASDLSGLWSGLRIFKFVPKILRDSVYKLIAKNRYKLFGKRDSCLMPTPDLRARFID